MRFHKTDNVARALEHLQDLPSGEKVMDILRKHKIKVKSSSKDNCCFFNPSKNLISLSRPLASVLAHEAFHGKLHHEKRTRIPFGISPHLIFMKKQMDEAAAHANGIKVYIEQLLAEQFDITDEDAWSSIPEYFDDVYHYYVIADDDDFIPLHIEMARNDPTYMDRMTRQVILDFLEDQGGYFYRESHGEEASKFSIAQTSLSRPFTLTKLFMNKARGGEADIGPPREPSPEELEMIKIYRDAIFIDFDNKPLFDKNDPRFSPENLWKLSITSLSTEHLGMMAHIDNRASPSQLIEKLGLTIDRA